MLWLVAPSSGSVFLLPFDSQVTRLQYLNALMASRVGQSPDPPEIKILPNSQTKLLNDRNTTQGSFAQHAAVWAPGRRRPADLSTNMCYWSLMNRDSYFQTSL